MKLLFILSLLTILTGACKKNNTVKCPGTTYSFDYKVNASVDTLRSVEDWLVAAPGNGNKLVFTYEMNYFTCPEIADGGLTQILLFEVNPSVPSFDYDSGDLQNAMVYYRRICFCAENGAQVPDSGTIRGKKLNNNSWQVDFDLVVDSERVKNSGVFTLK